MSENVFQRCEPDDPSRCQATGGTGQCPYRAVGTRANGQAEWEGSKYCPRHGGNKFAEAQRKESARLYLSAKWKEKIGNQAYHPKYKSLREEMGILRMTLETRLDFCQSAQDLLMYSGSITELVREIGKMAKVAHGIEKDMGHLLDKDQAEAWVMQLLQLIGNYVTDPDQLQKLAEDMVASLEEFTKPVGA